MAITVIRDLASTDQADTIGDLIDSGLHYRHPDSAQIAYPRIVEGQQAIGTLPLNQNLKIAIVGMGAAGIAALYELSKLEGNHSVTVFEPDAKHVVHHQNPRDIDIEGLRAGRVFAARAKSEQGEDQTVYEIGAMRFPEIAGLTWQYAQDVFGSDGKVKVFPNPGKVATEFVFGDQVERYKGETWANPDAPTRQVKDLVIRYLLGNGVEPLLWIGERAPLDVIPLLKAKDTSTETLAGIDQDWKQFAIDNDGMTLGAAVRAILASHIAELPDLPGLNTERERINYYFELFGRFGFGTGGFKSLFSQSIVEMMRLILWDYSNEYTLPVTENVQFLAGLYHKAKDTLGTRLTLKQARVCDVLNQLLDDYSAVIAYYPENETNISTEQFDYVILALPHEQLLPLINRAGVAPSYSVRRVGDHALGLGTQLLRNVLPPLLLDNKETAFNARAISAVSMLRMTRSAKVFGTFDNKYESDLPTFNDEPIKAVISDGGLAASYIVPSPIAGMEDKYSSFLASYTWDDDTTRQQRDFGEWPLNPAAGEADDGKPMFQRLISRADHNVKAAGSNSYQPWWFYEILQKVEPANRLSFDWSTHGSAGGFKIDMPGDHQHSNFCFRFHTHALDETLPTRFFLASDSYSHLGGWLEGAFMSAVNAVSGVVVAANGRGGTGVEALNAEAQKLFTTLDPITQSRA